MPDLTIGSGRTYSLVTTVVHRHFAQCKLAQLELHLTNTSIRLRFLDRESVARLYFALGQLARDAYCSDPGDFRAVRTQVFTEEDATNLNFEQQLMAETNMF